MLSHITAMLPTKEECAAAGARFVEFTEPVKVGPGCMTTGNIPWYEDVPFEPSPITPYHEHDHKMELDKTPDEVALAINLVGHGLVVISGCAHNGIINTVKRCQEVSGIQEVYAVLGGFYLGFPEEDYQRGLEREPDAVILDSGSTDPGPYMLGTGQTMVKPMAYVRDLKLILSGIGEKKIPLMIGSASGSGCRENVDYIVPATVRAHYAALNANAADCIGCKGCESRCPFHVPVVERMEKAKETFA